MLQNYQCPICCSCSLDLWELGLCQRRPDSKAVKQMEIKAFAAKRSGDHVLPWSDSSYKANMDSLLLLITLFRDSFLANPGPAQFPIVLGRGNYTYHSLASLQAYQGSKKFKSTQITKKINFISTHNQNEGKRGKDIALLISVKTMLAHKQL